ncbi:retropepsin-like aspartic protease [Aeoliella sp. SH292]|uniref:retropepsin-like aspartic protease n=1 Tax=Aeoliella sp. SH292 TaxID=3454464 RepID=UPI003F9523A8
MKWKYRKYSVDASPLCPSGVARRPEAKLRLRGANGDVYVRALVDTGADHCLFPLSIAEDIGVELLEKQADVAKGFSGHEVEVIPGRVGLTLLSGELTYGWNTIVGFAKFPSRSDECCILGRTGGLEHFIAIFDELNLEVSLEPVQSLS